MKVLVIPDIHLKTWILDEARKYIEEGDYDRTVLLGDLVDDWGKEKRLDLYKETLDSLYDFLKSYPDTLYCYGNHDISYVWEAQESGYSRYARNLVVMGLNKIRETLPAENIAFIHRIDNVLFSHAGLTQHFVLRCLGRCSSGITIDEMIAQINHMDADDLWIEDSPLWARPQFGAMRLYPMDMLQVVGHTPVEHPLREGNLISVDAFSTYYGEPLGDQKFVWVDTEKQEYHILE